MSTRFQCTCLAALERENLECPDTDHTLVCQNSHPTAYEASLPKHSKGSKGFESMCSKTARLPMSKLISNCHVS